MDIIKMEPYKNGGRPPIQVYGGSVPPDGYAEIACDAEIFRTFRGFVTLTMEDGKVTGMAGNQGALDAYLLACPDNPAPTPAEQITALKASLAATDYKIIKCSECSLLGEPLPYDIASLHDERQAIRDQINALEAINA